jgi:hypothetical protein
MRFDLRMLVAEAVARRSMHHLLPARLLPLIKTCEKIDKNHLCKVKPLGLTDSEHLTHVLAITANATLQQVLFELGQVFVWGEND